MPTYVWTQLLFPHFLGTYLVQQLAQAFLPVPRPVMLIERQPVVGVLHIKNIKKKTSVSE